VQWGLKHVHFIRVCFQGSAFLTLHPCWSRPGPAAGGDPDAAGIWLHSELAASVFRSLFVFIFCLLFFACMNPIAK
jgi:hypothetical protein